MLSIWKAECLRLWHNRRFILLCVGVILTGLILTLLFETRRFEDTNGTVRFTPDMYKSLTGDLLKMEPSDRLPFVALRRWDISAFLVIDPDRVTDEQKRLDGLHQQGVLTRYTGNLICEEALYQWIENDMAEAVGYSAYLTSIQNAAESLSGVSVFDDGQSFSYRNIRKTAEDYARLNGTEYPWTERYGILLATQNVIGETFFLFLIFAMCLTLITADNSMFCLYRTAVRGRSQLIRGKMITAIIFVFIINSLQTGLNISLGSFYYGLGDLSGPIQAVQTTAPFALSVWQYLLLFYLLRFFIFSIFAMVIVSICVIARKVITICGIFFAVMTLNAVLHYAIPAYSMLNIFKFINLFAFLSPSKWLLEYVNINIAGFPVSLAIIGPLSLVAILIFTTIATVLLFRRQRMDAKSAIIKNHSRFQRLFHKKGHSINIWTHEAWRLLIAGRVLWILSAICLMQFWYGKAYPPRLSMDELEYRQVVEQACSMQDPLFWVVETRDSLLANGGRQSQVEALNHVLAQLQYVGEQGNGAVLLFDAGYQRLLGHTGDRIPERILLYIGLILCVLPLREQDFDPLLRSAYRGRRYLHTVKLLFSLFMGTLLYFIHTIPNFFAIQKVYGLPSVNAPAFSIPQLVSVRGLSIGGYVVCVFLNGLAATWIICYILYAFSRKGLIQAVNNAALLFIIPSLLEIIIPKIFVFNPISLLFKGHPLQMRGDLWVVGLPISLFIFLGFLFAVSSYRVEKFG